MHAILACEKPEQRDPYRQILINCGVDCRADDAVLYGELAPRVNRGGAELLVVLLGEAPRETLQLVREIHDRRPMPTIVIGPSHDAALIMQAMSAGASEYLDIDLPRESVMKALEKLRRTGAIQFRRGQCIAVTSATPGSGVTTVASGLAFSLGATYPNQVLLGEIGVSVPELKLDLGLDVRNTVSQLLHDWDRVDASTVRQAAVVHPDAVAILADDISQRRHHDSEADACRQLISLVRTMYDYAVYDVGHAGLTRAAQQALQVVDRIVLVVRLDVPSLHLTRTMLNRFADVGILPEDITVVANRYGQRGQLNWRKVEETLGVPVAVWLPDDPGTVNQALNLGVPLLQVSGWAKLNRRLKDLAKSVNGAVKK